MVRAHTRLDDGKPGMSTLAITASNAAAAALAAPDNSALLIPLASSAVVAAIVSAFVAGFFNLRSLGVQYKHEYYKLVVSKRIAAYECVEDLVSMLKTAVADRDKRPYHLAFVGPTGEIALQAKLISLNAHATWLTHEIFDKTREMNVLLFSLPSTEAELIEFAKQNYRKMAELREEIETTLAADLLRLADIPAFLRAKHRVKQGFVPTLLTREWETAAKPDQS
jgi:hypothetical protein